MHTDEPKERSLSLEEKHQRQYEMLRPEMISLARETRRLEIYAVIAVAALYAWFFKEKPDAHYYWLLIGAVLVFLGALRSLALYGRINEITEYLIEIEKYLFGPTQSSRQLPGCERHRAASHNRNTKPQNRRVALAFWAVFLAVTTYSPVLLARFGEEASVSAKSRVANVEPALPGTPANADAPLRESVSTPVRANVNAPIEKRPEATALAPDDDSQILVVS
jgi:hypothetical protein